MSEPTSHLYILGGSDGKTPIPATMETWQNMMRSAGGFPIVAQDSIGTVDVSTIFIGVNYNFMDDDPPLVFETMVFDASHHDIQIRYPTWETALEGHQAIVIGCRVAGIGDEEMKKVERGPKVPDNRVKGPLDDVQREIVMADIAFLKQQEIDSGAREKWEADQAKWIPMRVVTALRRYACSCPICRQARGEVL